MQAETQSSSAWGGNSGGLLSVTMTALRLPVPEKISSQNVYFTLDEVSWHDHEKDCWIIIYDRVYDITEFLDQHPGGFEVLLEYAGRDATVPFRGNGHSVAATNMLKRYVIGELPPHECIYRSPGGIRLSGIPL